MNVPVRRHIGKLPAIPRNGTMKKSWIARKLDKLAQWLGQWMDGFNSWAEKFKKLLMNVLLVSVMVLTLIWLVREKFCSTLIIEPFKMPEALIKEGYSGEVLTSQLMDTINLIRQNGLSYIRDNHLILPQWDEHTEFSEGPSSNPKIHEVIQVLKHLLGIRHRFAKGEVVRVHDTNFIFFRIDGENAIKIVCPKSFKLKDVSTYILEHFDPCTLAAYCINTNQDKYGRELIQKLLFDEDLKNDELAYFLRAKSFMKTAEGYMTAKTMLYKALQNGKNKHVYYTTLAIINGNEDSLILAKTNYRKAISIKTDYPYAHFNLGNIYYKRFQEEYNKHKQSRDYSSVANLFLDSAISEFKNTIMDSVFRFSAFLMIGQAYQFKGMNSLCDENFANALELNPDDQIGNLFYANMLIERKDYPKSLQYYSKVYFKDSTSNYGIEAKTWIEKIKSVVDTVTFHKWIPSSKINIPVEKIPCKVSKSSRSR